MPLHIWYLTSDLNSYETSSVSIERTHHLTNIPSENNRTNPSVDQMLELWPSQGLIEFKNVSMKYRENTKIVLNDISFQIQPGEKIGLIGRTGSGKSSLFLCILRIVELDQGEILIDEQDIAEVGLMTLRKKISIIPQDPIIFLGNLKQNLDPFNEYSDQNIQDVLEITGLTILLSRQMSSSSSSISDQFSEENILDFQIQERGENLSVGERQLICIARAILKNSKILLLDEATSSIDQATDQKVQSLLREKFQQTTMIVIAHRLETLLDTDRVIRLSDGKVVDISDSKDVLLQFDKEEL